MVRGRRMLAAAGLALLAGCPAIDDPPPPIAPETMQVWVVFTRDEQPQPVLREVPRTEAVLGASLAQLVRGPTPEERAEGISSWFSSETAGILRDLDLDTDGRALVDFEDFRPLIPGASTSAGSEQLLWELNGTVFQFEAVTAADYRIELSCEAFWNFLQRPCAIMERPEA